MTATLALLLLLGGAMLPRIGERLVDWLVPAGLNFRIGAALARMAVALAASAAARDQARDALANIQACTSTRTGVNPIAVVAPVLGRAAASRVLRLLSRSQADQLPAASPGSYRHTNSRGVTYYLNSKKVTLRGGQAATIYFFSRDERPATACQIPPADRTVIENPRTGLVILTHK